MVNKGGWLRIVEASIAALLVLGALVIIIDRNQPNVQVDYSRVTYPILEEIAKNSTLRESVLNYNTSIGLTQTELDANAQILSQLSTFVKSRLNSNSVKYTIKICDADEICALDAYPGEVYASERIISTSIQSETFSPRKLKLFIYPPR